MASASKPRQKYKPPSAITQTIRVWEMVAARPSRIACPTVPRIATTNAAIIVLECPGSSPCSAPRRMALGMNSQACVEPCWSRSVKDGMASEILGDGLELVDRLAAIRGRRIDRDIQTMIEMVLDQRLLRLANGLFDRVELLRQIKAGAPRLDHVDHAAKMP